MRRQETNTHPRKGKHLNRDERIQIEVLLEEESQAIRNRQTFGPGCPNHST